ncbi:MAG: family 78 glycoside hydrolase catalytic domain, partial [Armatimonadota bacterium]
YGVNTHSYILGQPGLLVDCRIRLTGGEKLDISANRSWRVLASSAWEKDIPQISPSLGFPEILNLGLRPQGWLNADYDDASWQQATVVAKAGEGIWTGLSQRDIPFLEEWEISPVAVLASGTYDISGVDLLDEDPHNVARLMHQETLGGERREILLHPEALLQRPDGHDLRRLKPFNPSGLSHKAFAKEIGQRPDVLCTVRALRAEERKKGRGAYLLLDFGKEVTGYPFVRIASSNGAIIDIGYGEALDDGRVNPIKSNMRYADRLILSGGPEEWQAFNRRAFRYLQVDIRECPSAVVIESIGVLFSAYPVSWRGFVVTSDQQLNDIGQLCAYTVQLNMDDTYVNSPWRERAQRCADMLVESSVARYAFGDTLLARQSLKQIAESQDKWDGLVQSYYPGTSSTIIPGYTLIWLLSLWDYYRWTGDTQTTFALYGSAKKALSWFEERLDSDGLLRKMEHWDFWDRCEEIDLSGPSTIANAFLAGALDAGSRMAEVSGDSEMANRWAVQRLRIIASLNRKLWSEERGLYADCLHTNGLPSPRFSQQANAAAVLFGIAPSVKASPILKTLLSGTDITPIATPYFHFTLLQALWQNGLTYEALSLTRSVWGTMLNMDATTAWELLQPSQSLCHGWSTGPRHDLGAWVLGVRPGKPGFASVIVAPQPGDLSHAHGVVPTPRGDISVQWEAAS